MTWASLVVRTWTNSARPHLLEGMTNLIHVTVQYSNAVLVALLPHFTEFATKLELPIPLPITTNQVQRFVPGRNPGDIGGYLTLTNGWRFWYSHGYVDSFEAARNYYTLQDPQRIPEYFGKLNLKRKNDAVDLARKTLNRIGYLDTLTILKKEPTEAQGPEKYKNNTIPHYKIRWQTPESTRPRCVVEVCIDGEQSQVTSIFVSGATFWRAPPKIDIIPELESEYRKRVTEEKQIQERDPPSEKPKNDKK